MDDGLENRTNAVVGIFVLSCLASAFSFALDSVVACIIGLVVIAAILQVFRGGTNG